MNETAEAGESAEGAETGATAELAEPHGEERPDQTTETAETAESPEGTGDRTDQGTSNAPDIATVLGSADWVRHVPAEHLKTASKYASLGAFMKAHGELHSKLGEALFPPGADASDDERARFFARLGRPETPAGYRAPAVDGVAFDDAVQADFFEAAHAAGLTQAQVSALMAWQGRSDLAARQDQAAAHARAHETLAESWGEAAPAGYEMARRAATEALGADGMAVLGLGDDPRDWPAPVAAAMRAVAPSFTDSRHVHLAERDVGKSPAALRAEADRLMRSDDYRAGDEATHGRVQEIYRGLYGTDPVGPAAEHG